MLMVINVFSPQGTYDSVFLSNYTSINLRDAIQRVPGVGDASLLGTQDYGMRVWLDPDRMASLVLTASDIVNAIRAHNIQATAGQIGAAPIGEGQQFQYSIRAQGRLSSPKEFGDIVVISYPEGGDPRLRDIARIELDSAAYGSYGQLNGQAPAALAIYQAPGVNALVMAEVVMNDVEEILMTRAASPTSWSFRASTCWAARSRTAAWSSWC